MTTWSPTLFGVLAFDCDVFWAYVAIEFGALNKSIAIELSYLQTFTPFMVAGSLF